MRFIFFPSPCTFRDHMESKLLSPTKIVNNRSNQSFPEHDMYECLSVRSNSTFKIHRLLSEFLPGWFKKCLNIKPTVREQVT